MKNTRIGDWRSYVGRWGAILLGLAWICLGGAGCASLDATPLEASDRDGRTYQGRLAFEWTPKPKGLLGEGAALDDTYVVGPRFSSGLEIEVSHSDFRGRQDTATGDLIQISEDASFAGPSPPSDTKSS